MCSIWVSRIDLYMTTNKRVGGVIMFSFNKQNAKMEKVKHCIEINIIMVFFKKKKLNIIKKFFDIFLLYFPLGFD